MKAQTKKIIISIIMIFSLMAISIFAIIALSKPVTADVGSFQSYDSGSSSSYSSGSSSSHRSSYSSSDYSSDSSSGSIGSFFASVGFIIILFVGMFIYAKIAGKFDKNRFQNNATMPADENAIEAQIKAIDPNFTKEEFKAFAKDTFIKLQNAWTDRDWEKIRNFETNELFEQHKAQLDGYIKNNQINVMERICVNWVNLVSFEQSGEKEILTVDLNSRMGDYIIDATTKKVLKGNKDAEYTHTYTLKFFRSKGEKTAVGGDKVNTTNCPNCGAPTKIMTSGRCEYCGSVVTTSKHGWALGNLERKN